MTYQELLAYCEHAGFPPSVILSLIVACERDAAWRRRLARAIEDDLAGKGLTPALENIVTEFTGAVPA